IKGLCRQAPIQSPCASDSAHRVAPQVGQGSPVSWRPQHRGQGIPRLSQRKQLPASPQETTRKRNSKSVSCGASGRKQRPSLRLSVCMKGRADNGGDDGDVNEEENPRTDKHGEQNSYGSPPTFGPVHLG